MSHHHPETRPTPQTGVFVAISSTAHTAGSITIGRCDMIVYISSKSYFSLGFYEPWKIQQDTHIQYNKTHPKKNRPKRLFIIQVLRRRGKTKCTKRTIGISGKPTNVCPMAWFAAVPAHNTRNITVSFSPTSSTTSSRFICSSK